MSFIIWQAEHNQRGTAGDHALSKIREQKRVTKRIA